MTGFSRRALVVALAAGTLAPAALADGSTNPPCNPDLNASGGADQKDVAYLVDYYFQGRNPSNLPVATLDFNRDGSVDKDDIADLISTIAGGPCPTASDDGDEGDDEEGDDDDHEPDGDQPHHSNRGRHNQGHGQPRTCQPDINNSGAADQKDIAYLIEYINTKANPNHASRRTLDFNRDGRINQQDIDDLTSKIAGGPCPTRRRDDDHGPRPCQPDINGNGVADSKDVDYLTTFVASGANPDHVRRSTLDFNDDGRVNQKDIDDLTNKIAGGPCPPRSRGHHGPRHCWSGWTGHDRDRLRQCRSRGDMNRDNRCDAADAAELSRILATGLNPRGVNTDVNRDGQSNNADLLDLMRTLGLE